MSYQHLRIKIDRPVVITELVRRVKADGRHHLSLDVCRLLWGETPAAQWLELNGIAVSDAERGGWELTSGKPARPENGRLF